MDRMLNLCSMYAMKRLLHAFLDGAAPISSHGQNAQYFFIYIKLYNIIVYNLDPSSKPLKHPKQHALRRNRKSSHQSCRRLLVGFRS